MAFNIKKKEGFNYNSPQEMYQDNKMKSIRGLLDYQGLMIEKYMENIGNSNIAVELPTGSGKTLIGLLIGEFRRKKNKEKVLFLCPTKQLVNQVAYQAIEKYGIKVIPFCGKYIEYTAKDKASFHMADTIGITTYSAFFTQESMFKDVDLIIMDDVHSCEDYIVSNWTVKIDSSNDSFMIIANILKDSIGDSEYERLISEDYSSSDVVGWCNLVPMILLKKNISLLEKHISLAIKEGTTNYYTWKRINENILECNFYIQNKCILIRPWIAPTMTYEPFSKAHQRILMSATLGKSGELERVTGIDNIFRLPIVNDWDKKGLGRKFFILPNLSLGEDYEGEIFKKLHNTTNKKSVVLVPDDNYAKKIDQFIVENCVKTKIFNAKDIEKTKEEFINSSDAIVILSNRFDGIDFADNESRMLFVIDLPKMTNIQESFLMKKMGATILFAERIRTRIIQAVGRCSRNPSDYSVVCILGDTIYNDLTKEEKLNMYPPELRAELKFGIEMSKQYTNVDEILIQVNDFMKRNETWSAAEQYIVELRDEYSAKTDSYEEQLFEKLKASSIYEVKYQYAMWKKNYQEAYSNAINIIDTINAPSISGYRSYWKYIAGCLAYNLYDLGKSDFKSVSIRHFKEALNDKINIKWLEKLIFQVTNEDSVLEEDSYADDIISNIESNFIRYGQNSKFEKQIKSIFDNLQSQDGKAFERGHNDLGNLLGYISINIDATATPDPYWIINSNLCIVAEDKIYEKQQQEIPVRHVKEAMGHATWIKENERKLDKQAEIITIFVTNSEQIEDGARTFAKGIWYVNRDEFISWSLKAVESLREMKKSFVGIGDIIWRKSAYEIMEEYQTTPRHYIQLIKRIQLNSI